MSSVNLPSSTAFPFQLDFNLPNTDAFKTVSAGVFYALSRYQPYKPFPRDQVDGGIRYLIQGPCGTHAILFVLHLTPTVARLVLHFLAPDDPIQRIVWNNNSIPTKDTDFFDSIFQLCEAGVSQILGDAAQIEGINPPIPKGDLQAAVAWQAIYAPEMTDEQLAELVGRSPQSIRNFRSNHNLQKREQKTPRGKERVRKPPISA